MKQTMHDRFLDSEKRRKLDRNVLIKATQERVEAERLLGEANRKLLEADRTLEDAHLIREGWSQEGSSPRLLEWEYVLRDRWLHPSGFEMERSTGIQGIHWAVRRPSASATTTAAYSEDGSRSIYVLGQRFPLVTYYLSLEAALESWQLSLINMGRYPEPPPKDLFERLRFGVGPLRGI